MTDEPIGEEKPFPRRRVWLGRALLAVLLFLAAFFAVRIGAEIWLNRVLARRVAEYRRGEPVTPEDVASRPIPDEQNTVFYLLRAAAAYEANKEDDLAISERMYERHMTAIALAARLHECDVEQGTDAADAKGWIERYLGRWPDDPLRVTGTALVYPGIVPTGTQPTTARSK